MAKLNDTKVFGDLKVNGFISVNGGLKQDGNIILNGSDTWLRSTGQTGWYSDTYGGGIYMTDSSYIRTFNEKAFLSANTMSTAIYASEGGIKADKGFWTNRAKNNSAYWFADYSDKNHVLFNGRYGNDPTARGVAGSGFDGVVWNTYRGIHIRGGANGGTNCIVVSNSGVATTDHSVKLYNSGNEKFVTLGWGTRTYGISEANKGFAVTQTGGIGYGISLYGTFSNEEGVKNPAYGVMFALTASDGTYGSNGTYGNVSSDWATYFTMSHANNFNRGWIFKSNNDINGTSTNVASISNGGEASFRGSVFVDRGDWAANSSISLAIGDSDTGFDWITDGQFYLKSNNSNVAKFANDSITNYKPMVLTENLTVGSPSNYASESIIGCNSAPIEVPLVNVGSTSKFLPAIHQRATHVNGYTTHLSFGIHKNNVGWGEGISGVYIGVGGSDSGPTEYYSFPYGGTITHSRGYTYWHTGNDGSGSGLDADKLDGYHSYDFPTIIRANYVPESIGWHRIAHTSGGSHGMAIITLYGYYSGKHASAKFIVSNNHGQSTITQIMGETYNVSENAEFTAVRTCYDGTSSSTRAYNGCVFEVYFPVASVGINYTIEKISNDGAIDTYSEWRVNTGVTQSPWTQDKILNNIQNTALQTTSNSFIGRSLGVGGAYPYSTFDNGKAIALGDGDTGIRQNGDGILELWANNVECAELSSSYFTTRTLLVADAGINSNESIKLDNKLAFSGEDSWLRINNANSFTSGIYCGSSTVRTDGELQVGSEGSFFKFNNSEGRFSRPIITTADIIFSSRNSGIFGVYDSYKTDHIWSMGTSYRNSADGSNFGNLYGLAYKHTNNTTGGTMGGGHQMVWCTNGSPKGSIGEFGIWSVGNITAYSDARLKTNLEKINNPLEKIKQINGYYYDRLDIEPEISEHNPTGKRVGVIAQELLNVLPEVVVGGPTKKDPENKYSVDYSKINSLLIEGIKEQQKIIDTQQEEINSLNDRLKKLEKILLGN